MDFKSPAYCGQQESGVYDQVDDDYYDEVQDTYSSRSELPQDITVVIGASTNPSHVGTRGLANRELVRDEEEKTIDDRNTIPTYLELVEDGFAVANTTVESTQLPTYLHLLADGPEPAITTTSFMHVPTYLELMDNDTELGDGISELKRRSAETKGRHESGACDERTHAEHWRVRAGKSWLRLEVDHLVTFK